MLPPSLYKGCPFHRTVTTILQTQVETQQSLELVQTQKSVETQHKSESVETNILTYAHSQLMQVGHRIASLDSGTKGGVRGASYIPLLPFTAICEEHFLFMYSSGQ